MFEYHGWINVLESADADDDPTPMRASTGSPRASTSASGSSTAPACWTSAG
ncbi:hypothetical protein ACFV4F_17255 [Kitasatospora sp. NPDC059722]|uniref:hypothetical protein n=1 Tax=Kitasatospora sp. NPDC059722 TaxID=3346925 RepID=UPI0036A8477F